MKIIAGFLSALSVLFIGLTAGAALIYFEIFPYRYFHDAFIALESVLQSEQRSDDIATYFTGSKPPTPFDSSTAPIRDDVDGVTRYEPGIAHNGYTLYASGIGDVVVKLVDMAGKPVHEWTLDAEQLKGPRQDGLSIIQNRLQATPYLYSNGDLLLVLTVRGITPWGYGLVKLNKDSEIVWAFLEQVHHDVDIDADGNLYTLGHFIEKQPRQGLEQIEIPFVDDTVVKLSAAGEKLYDFSVLNAIRDSDYQGVLRYADPASYNGDILHANSIQVLDAAIAATFPYAEPGYLLLSLRNLDVVVLVDPAEQKVVWASRGYWHLQHDPEFLPNGNILLFDNLGDLANNGQSRVIEFDPATLEIQWEFPGVSDEELFSSVKSSQQRLANGNTLITETNNGRVLEVTPDLQVAWEFYIPERSGRRGKLKKVVDAHRFTAEELDFTFNNSDL